MHQAFGKTLGEHEGIGFMIADNEMDLHSARLNILHPAWVLDQGGQGVTSETIVMRIFKDIRAFRIYDGPSEVHRWSIARKIIGK
ncbi:MAG: (R)-benzylsuccinyl-CoA dehydrogenase BbsG, partial [Hydrocarboniphaga sp.]|nr:(R)-benzylsuccinyl-CoA dehydrogenase BbsG [Hydrocarboniphaga sp.]